MAISAKMATQITPQADTMTALQLRNPLGDNVDVPEFSATEAKNSFGRVLDAASSQGMVAITKRDRPTAVVLSLDAYQALLDARDQALGSLSHEFDALLLQMQTPASRQGMMDAFDASPEELGAAALGAVMPAH
jgi:prevent-host-death family protein